MGDEVTSGSDEEEPIPTLKILVVGNPADGFQYFGPFPELIDEITDQFDKEEWWCVDLNPVDDHIFLSSQQWNSFKSRTLTALECRNLGLNN